MSRIIPRVGQIVYLERYPEDKNKDGSPISSYGTGEYIVLLVGESTFQVVAFNEGAYGFHNPKTMSLTGSDRWNIARANLDVHRVARVARDVLKECEDVILGRTKAQWVGNVYTTARARAAALLDTLTNNPPDESASPRIRPAAEYMTPSSLLPAFLRVGRHVIVDGAVTTLPPGAGITATFPVQV
jgi:hypothetical protein